MRAGLGSDVCSSLSEWRCTVCICVRLFLGPGACRAATRPVLESSSCIWQHSFASLHSGLWLVCEAACVRLKGVHFLLLS